MLKEIGRYNEELPNIKYNNLQEIDILLKTQLTITFTMRSGIFKLSYMC